MLIFVCCVFGFSLWAIVRFSFFMSFFSISCGLHGPLSLLPALFWRLAPHLSPPLVSSCSHQVHLLLITFFSDVCILFVLFFSFVISSPDMCSWVCVFLFVFLLDSCYFSHYPLVFLRLTWSTFLFTSQLPFPCRLGLHFNKIQTKMRTNAQHCQSLLFFSSKSLIM